MLLDVLTRVAADSGYHLTDDRVILLRILNAGAREMHSKLECEKIYREVTLAVPINKLVTLPAFIGELRGMRENTMDRPFPLYPLASPRYISGAWNWRNHNWRDIKDTPIHTLPASIGQLTLEVAATETTNAVVIINGNTVNSASVEESVTMDATSKQTTNLFGTDIVNIVSVSARTYNITVKDADGNEIAILYNNANRTRYKTVDVSELSWGSDTANNETLVDVAYKIVPTYLSKNSDSFWAGDDYDEAWYNASMAVYCKPLSNKKEEYAKYAGAALASMLSNKGTTESQQEKKISFGENKFSMKNTLGVSWPLYNEPDAKYWYPY